MIALKRLSSLNLKVRDLATSLRWYRDHFGFERRYNVEGGVVISTEDIELFLSIHNTPAAPLADPLLVRCIHTLGFEVSETAFCEAKRIFSSDPDLVEIDQPDFHSIITADPDGYCVEIYFNKPQKQQLTSR